MKPPTKTAKSNANKKVIHAEPKQNARLPMRLAFPTFQITKAFLLACFLLLSCFDLCGETGGMAEFRQMKYGFFVHYVWWGDGSPAKFKDGRAAKSLDEFADAFDAEGFANDLASWQVEYVIFTAWHGNINPLFPCETMKKWGLPGHYCKRDLLGDVIKACSAKRIKVMFYTQPRDGHDLHGEEQVNTGWGRTDQIPKGEPNPDWSKFDYRKWNDFINDLYGELVDRYGSRIVGLYLDEGSSVGDSYRVINYNRLRQTIKSRQPNLLMLQNYYGSLYSCDIGDKEYHHWGEFAKHEGAGWHAGKMPLATCFAASWYGTQPPGANTVVFSAEDMFRFTVLQAGTNTDGGGVQWATGPYPGSGWETGVDETMRKVGSYLKPLSVSIKNTHASSAFPTQDGAMLKSVSWGVATDALDGSATYLHVLTAPKGKTLRIGMPANGVVCNGATHLISGKPVDLHSDPAGYLVTLPDEISWDALDTVIKLQVSRK